MYFTFTVFTVCIFSKFLSLGSNGMRPQTEMAHETLDFGIYNGQIGHHAREKNNNLSLLFVLKERGRLLSGRCCEIQWQI